MLGLVVSAGIMSRRMNLFQPEETKTISSFVYNIGLPALFFVKIAEMNLEEINYSVVVVSLVPIITILISLLVLKWLSVISKDQFVLYGLSIAFGSNAFFGVPFFESLYGQWGLDLAVFTGALLGVFGIILSLILLEYASPKSKGWLSFFRILKSPLMLAIISGLCLSLFKLSNSVLFNALSLLGKTASGAAIFVLGMFVYDHFSFKMFKESFSYVLFRNIALPFVTLILMLFYNISNEQLNHFLILQSGIPIAISIAIFSERYNYEIPKLTGMVIGSSLLSFFHLSVLFVLLKIYF